MLETLSPGAESSHLRSILETQYDLADKESQLGALNYLNHVVINCIPPKKFREVGEGWQWAMANRVIPSIEHSVGLRDDYKGPKKFWFTLPKGSDKTSFIGRLLNWSLAYTKKNLMCYAAAKDRDQALLLTDAMRVEASLNPWIGRRINFRNLEVDGTYESVLKVLAADAKGVAGIRGDLIILDELTQWENEDFFNMLMSGISKRASISKVDYCTLIIITNAGLKGDWQWAALNTAKRYLYPKGRWYVYQSPVGQRLASWMSEESIKEQSDLLPPGMVRQLFNNEWVDPGEDCGLVTREQARACEDSLLSQESRGRYGNGYVAAIDYGPIKDRTVCSIGYQKTDGSVVLSHMKVMQGSKENHVQIADVEKWIDWAIENFSIRSLIVDPYQMEATIQKYQRKVLVESFEARGGKANYDMAVNLRAAIVNKKLKWAPGTGDIFGKSGIHTLVDELSEVIVKPMAYGFRIDNASGKHDDRVCSLGMLLIQLLKEAPKKSLPEHLDIWF